MSSAACKLIPGSGSRREPLHHLNVDSNHAQVQEQINKIQSNNLKMLLPHDGTTTSTSRSATPKPTFSPSAEACIADAVPDKDDKIQSIISSSLERADKCAEITDPSDN